MVQRASGGISKRAGKAILYHKLWCANDSTILQTERIQAVIDKAAQDGGGVICIPKGTFLSGSLFSDLVLIFIWKRSNSERK